jgi:hypothetical protein
MDKKAVDAARVEFNRATDSIDALGASNSFEEIQTHWTAFLTAAGRVFTKLEQGSKAKSANWFGTKIHQRRTDPLLCYIWHARNADEHTLQQITQQHPGSIVGVTPTPQEVENFHRTMQQQPLPYKALAVLEVTVPHIRMLDVMDRGTRYSPPANIPVPYNAGMLALSMLSAILTEAEALIAP